MDTNRQFHENHALRRLYNSHPLAANRSLIQIKEHRNCSVISSPFQSQLRESRPNTKNNNVAIPPKRQTMESDTHNYKERICFPNEATLNQFRRKLNAKKRNMRNQNLVNSLRGGVCSAPLMAGSSSRKSKKDPFLLYQNPSRVSSMLVSRLSIQEKQELKMISMDDKCENNSSNNSKGHASVRVTTKITQDQHARCDNVLLPEINKSTTESENTQGALMFGRWGYRNRTDKKRNVMNCWTENYNESLLIKSTNINDFPRSPRSNTTRRSIDCMSKKNDAIDKLKAHGVERVKDIPFAPAVTPSLSIEEAASIGSSPTSESTKAKLEIVINPPAATVIDDHTIDENEVENDVRSLSPFSDNHIFDMELPPTVSIVSKEAPKLDENEQEIENVHNFPKDSEEMRHSFYEETDEKSNL